MKNYPRGPKTLALSKPSNPSTPLTPLTKDGLPHRGPRERHISRRGGEYLPLSRWRTLGYDVDAVVANDDKKWNAGLKCWCYRVCIESQYDENIEEAVREELHSHRRRMPSRSPPAFVGHSCSARPSSSVRSRCLLGCRSALVASSASKHIATHLVGTPN